MAKNRKLPPPPPEPPAPTTPVVRMSLPVPGGVIRLVHDRAAQVHEMQFEVPDPAKLPAAVTDLLAVNEFAAPAEPGGPWTRPVEVDRYMIDRLDAERVLLKTMDLLDAAGPPAKAPKRGRGGR